MIILGDNTPCWALIKIMQCCVIHSLFLALLSICMTMSWSSCFDGQQRTDPPTMTTGLNSLWLSGVIWWHRSGSTLVQVMVCCWMAPSHYANQSWLLISEILEHSPERNFTLNFQATVLYNEFENWLLKYTFEITATSPRVLWVNSLNPGPGWW